MKSLTKPSSKKWILLTVISIFVFSACQKQIDQPAKQEEIAAKANSNIQGHLKQTNTYPSEVIIRWLNMQLDMLRVPLAPGTGSQAADRCQPYCGIAAYESVVPGMPAYQSLSGQLTDFPDMPKTEPGKAYHWAASANAALAYMNRKLFPTTSAANKTAMDNLENSLNNTYATEVDAATLQRSIAFGTEVATRIFAWAGTDGSANVNPPYIPPPPTPAMPWLWVPTALPPATPVYPYAYQRRLLVPGVANGTALAPPPTYSIVPGSEFWNMAKDVYDKSFSSTDDQKASAIYNRDNPGYPAGGHFVAIYSQALSKAQPGLDVAALGYAKMGIGQHDATIICFTNKYYYNLVRPITYIRNVMGHPEWNSLIPAPNHPEFPSGHATINSSVMEMLTNVLGDNFQLTLHTYDYMGLPARSFNSFYEMGLEQANSRVFGGIHYQATCDKSRVQGKKVAQNILSTLKFLKE